LRTDPWNDLRRRQRLVMVAMIGFLPVSLLVGGGIGWLPQWRWALPVAAVGWLALFALASARMRSFPCPLCGKPFFHTFFVHNDFARRCVHCRWPKWAPPPTQSRTAEQRLANERLADPADDDV
jgi:hypothetical protein